MNLLNEHELQALKDGDVRELAQSLSNRQELCAGTRIDILGLMVADVVEATLGTERSRALTAALDEYVYWRDMDEQPGGDCRVSIGGMGAAANIVGAIAVPGFVAPGTARRMKEGGGKS